MSYVYSITGTPVQPSEVMYREFTIAANTTLTWPFANDDSADTTALFMDVTASAGSLSLTLPSALQASTGYAVIIKNAGAETFTVKDNAGGTLTTVTTGVAKYFLVSDNTTAAGTWNVLGFGSGTTTANASDLAGYGLKAISATLNENHPVNSISTTTNIGLSGRAQLYNWTGGVGDITFDSCTTLGDGFVTLIRNSGTGILTLNPDGGELINGAATFEIYPDESALVLSDGTGLYLVGYAVNQGFIVGSISIGVGGNTDVTLTVPQIQNLLMEFTGVLTGDIYVNFPAVNNIYLITNNTTGAFNLTVRPIAGTGVIIPQTTPRIVACDTATIYFGEGVGGGTVTSITAGTGLTGGVSTGAGTVAIDVTGVAAATYTVPTITVNAQGQITAASSGTVSAASITGVIAATQGGTGVANNVASTTTISGAYAQTITLTGVTAITFPTSGTLTTLPTVLATVNAYTKQQNITPQALTSSAASIAWNVDNGNVAQHTATENTTLENPTNLINGGVYTFEWRQHASAAKTLAFGSKWKFAGSSTVSATVSSVQIFTGMYNSSLDVINTVMTGPFS